MRHKSPSIGVYDALEYRFFFFFETPIVPETGPAGSSGLQGKGAAWSQTCYVAENNLGLL